MTEYDIEEVEDQCPECGGETKELITYSRGHKGSDGFVCRECDWEWTW